MATSGIDQVTIAANLIRSAAVYRRGAHFDSRRRRRYAAQARVGGGMPRVSGPPRATAPPLKQAVTGDGLPGSSNEIKF